MAKGVLRREFRRALAIRPARIRDQAQRPFRFRLAGASDEDEARLARFLVPDDSPREREDALAHIEEPGRPGEDGELIWLVTPAYARSVTGELRHAVVLDPEAPVPGTAELCRRYPRLCLSFARAFPALRGWILSHLIQGAAGQNAFLAGISALPDVVPTPAVPMLTLAEMGSDTILLTANQVRLAFALAAAQGLEVGWRAQAGEVGAILGSAFGWRSLARGLVSMVPCGVGMAAKCGIAYSGTVIVGKAVLRKQQRRLARGGRKPSAHVLQLPQRVSGFGVTGR